ncbi:multiple sugar transport system substrate-binding protein [Streptosporangium becharense]|uniref:Multiple sugar transport system substrate-binding protein n=1 Tax=Streptosporangium becharense TaxID=1816182 RepID=A0A7W9MIW3_9ACTN|nr:sugar ABC transporter substrate-binding protein [Streptosporangium becharense]MBB2911570.1 multiple sugar transport system substrate-binding protein [Streptosporangium becharense]MBB5822612.1 multiple sugar transport system substrate-binding protein [Streptosporangium becharense]
MRRRDLLRAGGLAALGAAAAACGAGGGAGPAGGTQLQFMYWGSTFEQKAVAKMLQAFEKQKPGVRVRPLFTPDEYDVKLNALVAGNRTPDVGYVPMSMSFRLAEQGKLVNLHPYLGRYPQLAGYLPDAYLWYGPDKLHGVATANESMLLWYGKTAVAEAGITAPPADAASAWTWDQLVQNAYKLTVDQNGRHPDESGFDAKQIRQFGVSISFTYAAAWYGLLRGNGGDFADEAGRKCLLDSPEAIEVFQNLQDLVYKHRVAPGPGQLAATGDEVPGTSVLLKTKRVAMVVDGHWALLDMNESKADYGIGVLPKYDKPYTTTQVAGASSIFTTTKHVEEAVELFAFHIDPRYVDLFKQGLWMPQERKYYEDQAAIDSWAGNAAHPPEFRTAVIDYTRDHGVPDVRNRLRNMSQISSDVLTPALQEIESGKRPAAEVLKEAAPKITGMLQGWQHTQGL